MAYTEEDVLEEVVVPVPGRKPHQPWQHTCPYCDVDITPIQANHTGHCGDPTCATSHKEAVVKRTLYVREVFARSLRRRAYEACSGEVAAFADSQGRASDDISVSVVPFQAAGVVPLPEERLAAFTQHLDEIFAAAFENWPPEENLSPWDNEPAPQESIVAAACGSCRGWCCRQGGPTHAFLSKQHLQMLRLRDDTLTPESLRAYYVERLPEVSVDGACVYQAEFGCTLDRDMRADICNKFHCGSLKRAIAAMSPDRPSMIIAQSEGRVGWVAGHTEADGPIPIELLAAHELTTD